jgi:hypothetical protein
MPERNSAQKLPRQCKPCTACCQGWLRIETPVAQATLGSPCSHCAKNGCGIYETRPVDPCQTFNCAWRKEGSSLADWMRPDQCKAIVMFDRLKWRGQPAIVAVAVGARIPLRTVTWLQQYAQLHAQPLLLEEYEQLQGSYTGRKRIVPIGTDEFIQAMMAGFRRGEQLW